ncbi:GGDEF domain-containing protein [Sporosarcina sp. ACRSL]|uniref:sensor domain-containing diguanylate cyclase n=1 Tax=Sporosarcina sp. ACRSL TaxID=2918215 RepID=UPI001EF5C193|nr:sensor domain-containing diguanylate cyclase [Sporosarcina sp. ACRSL]MCG7344997.1 GGDEF domain-containing protein [Sporosarcina sp. ACRSL]
MKITAQQQRSIFILWLLVVPLMFYIALNYFPAESYDYVNMAIYLAILIATLKTSIPLDRVSLTLERWVIFSLFFQYGVVAEMIFMQIASFVLLFIMKSPTPKAFRFAFNSINFAVVSIISGAIFYIFGGPLSEMSLSSFLLAGFLYASAYSLINSSLIYLFFKWLKTDTSGMKKVIVWDYVSSILLLPFAITFCLLMQQFGSKAFLLIGVPFLLVLLVASNYMNSNKMSQLLASSTVIGHQLADNLLVENVHLTFIDKIKGVIPYDSAYIVDLRMGENLVLLSFKEGEFRSGVANRFSLPPKRSESDGLEVNSTRLFLNRKSIDALKAYTFDPSVESVMTAPIKRNEKTEGFLILTSHQRYAFDDVHVKIVDLLTGYFATAVEKARYYEKTVEKSVTCGLTGLYNYRYLESKLDEEMIRYHTGEISTLSAIMLDIDHFKSINDTYGHQSGNDLLRAYADLLRSFRVEDMTLARYGGEEFVMLLPNCEKEDAIEIAEMIRKEVEQTKFKIIPDLSEDREPIIIDITISVGVATMPIDAKDGKELLRNADRALYIGGKQAGRNKVGIYEEDDKVTI